MKQVADLRAELTAAGILESPLTHNNSQAIAETLQLVAEAHEVTAREVMSQNRGKRVSRARRDVFAALKFLGLNNSEIGRAMGRDHSTVVQGLRRREKELQEFAAVQGQDGLSVRRAT